VLLITEYVMILNLSGLCLLHLRLKYAFWTSSIEYFFLLILSGFYFQCGMCRWMGFCLPLSPVGGLVVICLPPGGRWGHLTTRRGN